VSSPTGAFVQKFTLAPAGISAQTGQGTSYNLFDTYINAVTNGNWTIVVTNYSFTNYYTFTVSVAGLTSNSLPPITITFPLNGAVNVTNQPNFRWQGASVFGGTLSVEAWNNSLSFFQYASVPTSQSNWTASGVLPNGPMNFEVYAYSNMSAFVIASTPLNTNTVSPISDWISAGDMYDIGSVSFTITNNGVAPPPPFTYTTNVGTITITGYTGTNGPVTIPDTINGLPVRTLGSGAFQFLTSITSLTLSTNVTSIGFSACYSCYSLASVTIPAAVTNIGGSAFAECPNLTAINVDSANSYYSSLGGVLFDKTQATLMVYPNGLSGTYTVPGTVHTIADFAFTGSYNLTGLVIPFGVNSIGVDAFLACANLASVTIPASVTSLGSEAFADCASLTAITVNAGNPVYSSLNGVLFDKVQTTLVQFPAGKSGSYAIPGTVTSLGDQAFFYCTGLTNVTIPGSVTNIGNQAFYACTGLSSIIIPSSVMSLGIGAFEYCSGLVDVTVPSSITFIQAFTFYYCSGLRTITLPASINTISDDAFDYCTSLLSVYFLGNAPVVYPSGFVGDSSTTAYYMPGTTGWSSPFDGIPAVLWNPQVQTSGPSFGVHTNRFGFNITGNNGLTIVIVGSTELSSPVWMPLSTNTITAGSVYFSDPQWASYSHRFYRLRSP
jgi:hypothetical protein